MLPLLVTNGIKLSGLYIALHEIFALHSPRTVEVLLSMFMMAGGQASEKTVLKLGERFFAWMAPEPHEGGSEGPPEGRR